MPYRNSLLSYLFKSLHNSRISMNPTAVVPNLQAFGFGGKHDKLRRIVALEEKAELLTEKVGLLMRASERGSEDIDNKLARIELLEERVSILIKFCDKESRDVQAMDQNLTGQIEHAKEFMMAEIKGVALDLAKIRAWKERLMLDHPELKSTTEPSTTFRNMKRPTKMSDPPPSAPPRPGEEWKQTFNYPRRAEN